MRKGQEEMVGFVMIVVLLAVIFLIFIGLNIRGGDGDFRESGEVVRFLESSMEYTTDCAIGYIPAYANLGELFRECYESPNELCAESDVSVCESLNEALEGIIQVSFNPGEDSQVKGYEFEAFYESGDMSETILSLEEGQCGSNIRGARYINPGYGGKIAVELNLCY